MMRDANLTRAVRSFFEDKHDQVILWQAPNIPIYGWAIFKTLSLIATQPGLQTGLQQISSAFLFVWAYLELTKGVNYFRKTLGFFVLGLLIVNFFDN
jgi:hypothetical protein